jgi:hypothetical protein
MLARERSAPADAVASRCTALAAALVSLPSRPLDIVGDALAALGVADVVTAATTQEESGCHVSLTRQDHRWCIIRDVCIK